MSMKIFNNPLLERALDASWLRNEAISNNIANVDTPGYKRQDVNFEEYLKAAINKDTLAGISSSNPKHIPINNPSQGLKVIKDYSDTTMRIDGNNVDVDSEMNELAKNQILYNTYAEMLSGYFSKYRTAIKEGR